MYVLAVTLANFPISLLTTTLFGVIIYFASGACCHKSHGDYVPPLACRPAYATRSASAGWHRAFENWIFWALTLSMVDLAFVSHLRSLAYLFEKQVRGPAVPVVHAPAPHAALPVLLLPARRRSR